MEIQIRQANTNDYSACKEIGLDNYKKFIKGKNQWIASYLFKQYFKEASFLRRSKENVEIYVALNQDEIVGFIEVENRKNLSSIYVKISYHKCGIGSLLLSKAEELCLMNESGHDKMYLEASDYAIEFYHKKGYQKSKEKKKVLGVNMTPMVKKLK